MLPTARGGLLGFVTTTALTRQTRVVSLRLVMSSDFQMMVFTARPLRTDAARLILPWQAQPGAFPHLRRATQRANSLPSGRCRRLTAETCVAPRESRIPRH